MRLLSGILMGSAAGLVAISAAQAADFPVKAKKAAVQYVKICSLYGDGFYYVPGTDICLKFGGFVRSQIYVGEGMGPSATAGPYTGANGAHTRTGGADWVQRSRAVWTVDTRQSTSYGTLRTYTLIGFSQDNPGQSPNNSAGAAAAGLYANRAFIQFAGFTFGKAQSFYDMYPSAAYTFFANRWTSDTGDSGQLLTAYTATFGGGMSATIALEDPRRGSVTRFSTALALGAAPSADNMQIKYPDVVANLRGDWTWGSLQVMGALHDSSGGYYGATEATGHPSDIWGYALGVGGVLKVPTGVADTLGFQFNYTKGATRYAALLQGGFGNVILYNSSGAAVGWIADGVYGAGTAVDLTTMWGLNVGFDHGWSPTLRTSLYGTWEHVDYSGTGQTLMSIAACGTAVCGNPDFSMWLVGSRTQWNPVKGLVMGVDVMYERIQTAFGGNFTGAAFNGRTAGYPVNDQGVWEFTVRVQRDILP